MRSNYRPSKFKEHSKKLSENTNSQFTDESKTRSPKEYVVEIDLTSQNIQPIETSIANSFVYPTANSSSTKLPLPPVSPKLHVTRENIRTDHMPKQYIDKLNRAIDDLHSFEEENTRLMTVNQKTEQRNIELQSLNAKLQQQLSLQRSTNSADLGPEINRYRTALQQKQSQIRGYCVRVKLIEQKLQEYELQRKANAILTNYYETLSSLFGKEQLQIEELRTLIEQAVSDSRQYRLMFKNQHAMQHQQNEDLERAIKNYNAVTFEKNTLQLKLINMSDERQELLRKLDLDRKKLDRSTTEIQSLKSTLETLRMENENLKIQLQRPIQVVDNSQTTKNLQHQLQVSQKDNEALKRQTAELRRVVQSYKNTLSQTQDVHSRETQHMSSMLAELRKNYYQTSHKLSLSQSIDDAAVLKQALSEANKTIQHLTQAQNWHNTKAEEVHRLRQQIFDVKAKYHNLERDYDTLNKQAKNDNRLNDDLNLQLNSLRQQLRALQNNVTYQQKINALQEELERERVKRKQYQRNLALKSNQYDFIQTQLDNYHKNSNQKSERRVLYEQTIQNMEYSNRQLQQQLKTLEKQYAEFERNSEERHLSDKQQMKRYSAEMTDNLNHMRRLVEEKHLLESQLSQTKYVLEDVRQSLTKNLNEKDNQIDQLTIAVSQSQHFNQNAQNEYSGKLTETQKQLMELRTQYTTLQNQYTSMQNQYNSLLSEYSNLQTQHVNLQSQYTNLQAHYTNLQSQNTSRQNQYISLHNQLIEAQNQVEVAEQSKLKLNDEIRLNKENLQYQTQQLDQANVIIRRLEGELSKISLSLNEQCLDMQSRNREMSIQIGHLNQQLMELQIELDNRNLQFSRVKNELNARTQRSLQLEKVYDDSQVELRRLRQTLSDMEAQMRHLMAQQQHVLSVKVREKEDQINQLKQEIRAKLQQLNWAKNENKGAIEEYQLQHSSMEFTIKELEGRLSRTIEELNNENNRTTELKKLYESQIACFTTQIREMERQRQQSQNKLISSEQKFANMKTTYMQIEQAANKYRNQFESLKAYCQRRQEEHQQQFRSIQASNSAKINEFMTKQTFLEKRMSEVVSQTQSEYSGNISQLEERNQSLQQRYSKEMHDYQGKVKELRHELALQATKGEEKCRKLVDEANKKETFYKEELNKLNNQLAHGKQQQRNSQLMKEKQLMIQNEELQNGINDYKQRLLKSLQQLNDLKQQLSLTNLEHEARVQQLREKVKVAQNKLEQYRNEHGGRELRVNDQVKSLKDENYALQTEKINLATKLQMSDIKIDELQSENNHLKNEIQEMRQRQRMSLYETHGDSNPQSAKGSEGHLENYFRNSMNMADQVSDDCIMHFEALNSGGLRTMFLDEEALYSDLPTEFRTFERGPPYKWKNGQTGVSGRPASAHRINSAAGNVLTISSPVDTHVNFNYSRYYEENIKQIKNSMLSNPSKSRGSSPPQHKPFRFSKLAAQGEQSKQDFGTKKTAMISVTSPKMNLQSTHPNIPRSPKTFTVNDSPSPEPNRSPTSYKSPEYVTRPISLNINNALSTNSLTLETEPSELQIGSSRADNQFTGHFQQYTLQ